MPFSDSNGKLELSSKQKQKLKRWARPDEFIAQPTMLQIGRFYLNIIFLSVCSSLFPKKGFRI